MPTYPATRRFFLDAEFLNGNAATAGLVRALARNQNFRYARDLKVTPADPKVFGGALWAWQPSSFCYSPLFTLSPGGSANLAEFVVPDPRGPATWIELYVYIDRAAMGAVGGSVTVTNRATGATFTEALTNASASYWLFIQVRAEPGDVLRLSATSTSGTPFAVAGLSAWWASASFSMLGATFGTGVVSTMLSQAFHVDDSPLSTYALKWLGRMANASVSQRPQPIAFSWFGSPGYGVSAGYNTYSQVVGRYILSIGGLCPSLTVRVRYRASGACTIAVAISGGASGTLTIPGAGTSVVSTTVTLTPGGAPAGREMTLTVNGAPAYCDVESVVVWEDHGTAASLSLPSGETVPTSFDPNHDELMGSGLPIRADAIARLVANEIWLWAYRRDRVLVNDCRFTYKESVQLSFTGSGGLTDRAALHEIRTSKRNAGDALGELKIRSGWHQSTCNGKPTPWVDTRHQVGVVSLGDYPGSPAVGEPIQHYGVPAATWDSFSQASWQHARGGVVGGETNLVVETVVLTNGTNTPQNARPAWLTVEELPLDSPAATYP